MNSSRLSPEPQTGGYITITTSTRRNSLALEDTQEPRGEIEHLGEIYPRPLDERDARDLLRREDDTTRRRTMRLLYETLFDLSS